MTNTIDSDTIMEVLKEHQDELIKYGVKKIGLFGSFVRGEQTKRSDIDFLIEFDLGQFGENFKGLYDAFMALSDYLENLYGRKIELLTKDSISPYIQPYVEKEVKWYETKPPVS